MSRLTRDGTAEPVSRGQILRSVRGQGNINFPCSADHEQDWQPYPVEPYPAMCDDHTICLRPGSHTQLPNKTDCLCPLLFCLFFEMPFFSKYFSTIVVLSLYGEYIVRFSLPDGIFLPPCDHDMGWILTSSSYFI